MFNKMSRIKMFESFWRKKEVTTKSDNSEKLIRNEISKEEYSQGISNGIFFMSRDNDYFNKMMVFSCLVPSLLEEIFGKCDFKYKGEYLCSVWSFGYDSIYFFIISANEKGTSIEATVPPRPSKDQLEIVKEFVDIIYDKVKVIDNPKIKGWIEVLNRNK